MQKLNKLCVRLANLIGKNRRNENPFIVILLRIIKVYVVCEDASNDLPQFLQKASIGVIDKDRCILLVGGEYVDDT